MRTVEKKLTQVQKDRILNLNRQINEFQKELTALCSFMVPDEGAWNVDVSKVNDGLLIFIEREGESNGQKGSQESSETGTKTRVGRPKRTSRKGN